MKSLIKVESEAARNNKAQRPMMRPNAFKGNDRIGLMNFCTLNKNITHGLTNRWTDGPTDQPWTDRPLKEMRGRIQKTNKLNFFPAFFSNPQALGIDDNYPCVADALRKTTPTTSAR